MKEGWEYIALSSVCKVQNGFAFNSKLFNESNNGVPLIRIRDIKRGYSLTCTSEKCSDEYFVENGDMLIGMDGDFNIGEWKGGHALLNQRVCKLIPSERILAKFIFYFIPEALQRINNKTAFSTVKHLSSKQVNAILLPNLPLPEQQSIVDYLDSAFAKIDAMKANAEKALNEAKALFQASLKEMLEPKEGWEKKQLGEVCELSQGLAINSKTRYLLKETGQLPLLRIKDMKDGTREVFVDEKNCPQNCIANEDDIIYTRTGTLGLVFTGMKGVLHNNCFKITFNNSILEKSFFMYFLSHEAFRSSIIKLASRAAQPDITHKLFKTQEIVFPSILEQKRIAEILDSLKSKVDRLQANFEKISQECDALKQAILRQVFE